MKGKKPEYKCLDNKTVGWKQTDKNGEAYISIKLDLGALGTKNINLYKSSSYQKIEEETVE